MNLLPVIYASLLVFATILAFVILVSYISFKVKNRHMAKNSRQQEILKKIIRVNYSRNKQSGKTSHEFNSNIANMSSKKNPYKSGNAIKNNFVKIEKYSRKMKATEKFIRFKVLNGCHERSNNNIETDPQEGQWTFSGLKNNHMLKYYENT